MSEGEERGVSVAEDGLAAEAGAEVAALRARLVQAELRTEAVRAGMVDLDGVKLIEMSSVKLKEDGALADGAGVMTALRVAKPWLFGRSSSSSATAPKAEPPREKKAMDMSVDEWRLARAELLRRR